MYIKETVITWKTYYNLILLDNLYINIYINNYKYYIISLNMFDICFLKTQAFYTPNINCSLLYVKDI